MFNSQPVFKFPQLSQSLLNLHIQISIQTRFMQCILNYVDLKNQTFVSVLAETENKKLIIPRFQVEVLVYWCHAKGVFKTGFKIFSPTRTSGWRGFLWGKLLEICGFSLSACFPPWKRETRCFPFTACPVIGSFKEPLWELGIYSLELEETGIWLIPVESREAVTGDTWTLPANSEQTATSMNGLRQRHESPKLDVTGGWDLVLWSF